MKNIIVTNLRPKHYEELRDIHTRNCAFPMPNLENHLYTCRRVVISDGEIIGASIARLTSEIVLILDKKQPKTLRARAVKALHNTLLCDLQELGMDECHIFVPESEGCFIEFMKDRFNFVSASGAALYRSFYAES